MSERFIIMGCYRDGQTEELDSSDSIVTAEYLEDEYRMAFGGDWDIWTRDSYVP